MPTSYMDGPLIGSTCCDRPYNMFSWCLARKCFMLTSQEAFCWRAFFSCINVIRSPRGVLSGTAVQPRLYLDSELASNLYQSFYSSKNHNDITSFDAVRLRLPRFKRSLNYIFIFLLTTQTAQLFFLKNSLWFLGNCNVCTYYTVGN